MSLGASLFLVTVGAILHWAVTAEVAGIDIQIVGTILMIVGVIGLIMTAFIWGPRSRGRGDVVEERRVYDDRI